MAVDPVSQRHNMTAEQFNGLSKQDQKRVIEAKMTDQIMKPLLDKATSRMKEAKNEMSEKLKGK